MKKHSKTILISLKLIIPLFVLLSLVLAVFFWFRSAEIPIISTEEHLSYDNLLADEPLRDADKTYRKLIAECRRDVVRNKPYTHYVYVPEKYRDIYVPEFENMRLSKDGSFALIIFSKELEKNNVGCLYYYSLKKKSFLGKYIMGVHYEK
jgi:hypothetical protein